MKNINIRTTVFLIIALVIIIIGIVNTPIQSAQYVGARKEIFDYLAYTTTALTSALFLLAAYSSRSKKLIKNRG